MLGSVRIERPFGIITYIRDLCICSGLLRVSLRTGKLRSAIITNKLTSLVSCELEELKLVTAVFLYNT